MPLDTNIALNASAPAPINPLQQALQIAQYRAYNANGLAAQQGLDANRAISAAYQQATDPTTGQVDNNKLMAIISQNPAAGFKLGEVVQGINTQKQQQQTLARGDIALSNDQRNNYADSTKFLTQQMATVDPKDPNAAKKIIDIGTAAVQQGHIPAAMFKSVVAQFPDDASQWPQFIQKRLASFQDPGAQLGSITPKPVVQDLGGSVQVNDSNPITNPNYVGTQMKKSLTPGEFNQPVNVLGGPGGNTPGIKPLGEVYDGAPPLPSTGPTTPNGPDRTYLPSQPAPTQPAQSRFAATGLPPGAGGIADDAGKRYGALTSAASAAKQVMGQYDNAAALVSSTMKGKGSGGVIDAAAVLNSMGVPVGKDAVESRQLLTNYLSSATDQAAQSLGMSGSDARLAAVKAGQPSADTMNGPALYKSIMHVKGLQQAVLEKHQAETAYLAANGNNTANLNQWEAQWNKSFNPEVSYVRALNNPQEQQAAMQEMKAQGKLGAWMKDYKAMKDMGAF